MIRDTYCKYLAYVAENVENVGCVVEWLKRANAICCRKSQQRGRVVEAPGL